MLLVAQNPDILENPALEFQFFLSALITNILENSNMFGRMKHKQPGSFSIVKRPKPKILASVCRRPKHKHRGNSSIFGRADGFFLKMPVRLAPWARKRLAYELRLLHSQARSERERKQKRERQRARERERESKRERERERDGSEHRQETPHSGHSEKKKKQNKLYTEKLEKAGTVEVKSAPVCLSRRPKSQNL